MPGRRRCSPAALGSNCDVLAVVQRLFDHVLTTPTQQRAGSRGHARNFCPILAFRLARRRLRRLVARLGERGHPHFRHARERLHHVAVAEQRLDVLQPALGFRDSRRRAAAAARPPARRRRPPRRRPPPRSSPAPTRPSGRSAARPAAHFSRGARVGAPLSASKAAAICSRYAIAAPSPPSAPSAPSAALKSPLPPPPAGWSAAVAVAHGRARRRRRPARSRRRQSRPRRRRRGRRAPSRGRRARRRPTSTSHSSLFASSRALRRGRSAHPVVSTHR